MALPLVTALDLNVYWDYKPEIKGTVGIVGWPGKYSSRGLVEVTQG